ncbi:hypothetical protein KR018_012570, partial [Drosophila ironensis]
SASYLQVVSVLRTVKVDTFEKTEGGQVNSWLLQIMDGETFACGAAYYKSKFALTSANCLDKFRHRLDNLVVRFTAPGEGQDSPGNDHAREVGIRFVFVSQDWRRNRNYMDVAVLKLSNRLRGNFHNFVQLCSKPLSSLERLTVVACAAGPEVVLRTEQVQILGRLECEQQYGDYVLDETLACAKEMVPGPDCMFEPGCPVTSRGGTELCGIVAVGPACHKNKSESLPGIFTDVRGVRAFIFRAMRGR